MPSPRREGFFAGLYTSSQSMPLVLAKTSNRRTLSRLSTGITRDHDARSDYTSDGANFPGNASKTMD